MKSAIFAGSFDPIHEGHISVIKKSLKIFEKLYIIVSINPDKINQGNIYDRYNLVKKKLSNIKNIEILINENDLIANIAKKLNVDFLIRSARNNLDFESELVIAAANNSLSNNLETILIVPDYKMINYSSTLLRHKKKLKKD